MNRLNIDLPVIWKKDKDKATILNPGEMDSWPNIKREKLQYSEENKIYHTKDNQLCVASLDDFIRYFRFDGTWDAKYQGYFTSEFGQAIRLLPKSGKLFQMMKSIDMLLRRFCKESQIECTATNNCIFYEIWMNNTFAKGNIKLTKVIEVGMTLYLENGEVKYYAR